MPVYLIQAGDVEMVKIGKAISVATRMTSLQTSHHQTLRLLRLFRGGLREERLLRQQFTHCKVRGEWYKFCNEMMGEVGLEEVSVEQAQAEYQAEYRPYLLAEDRSLWRQARNFERMSKSGESADEIFLKLKQRLRSLR